VRACPRGAVAGYPLPSRRGSRSRSGRRAISRPSMTTGS